MMEGTRDLAVELLKAEEFDAAFFFAHAAAALIRGCEAEEAQDEPKVLEKWARRLDEIMVGAVKGWRLKSGRGQKPKEEAAAMLKLLVTGRKSKGCDQTKWYPETLKELRAWAK